MLKAILFDMDDTLLDWSQRSQDWGEYEREHLAYVLEHVAGSGHTVQDIETFFQAVRTLASQSWIDAAINMRAPKYADAIEQALAQAGVPAGSFDHETLLRAYRWGMMDGVLPFPDVTEVLPILVSHGVKLGLVTNASTPMWSRDIELEAAGILGYFSDCRISAVDVGYLKPHPLIFQHALEQLNVASSEVVFVGDNPEADVLGAQNVGMKAVLRLVRQMGSSTAKLVSPDAQIQTLHELLPYLDEWFPGWRS
ncbi:MAG: HAD family hydrolase [Anaerolineae bacterium]|nr:HAD family hydrolase [Anaerolineae bacterium]